jgi:hypothetical protein
MNWTDKRQVIALTALATAALVLGGATLLMSYWMKPLVTDDAPIVMLGGSFRLVSFGTDHLDGKDHKLAHKSHHEIEQIEVNGQAYAVSADPKIDSTVQFSYCDPSNCSANQDTITVRFRAKSNSPVEVTNTNGTLDPDANVRGAYSHSMQAWKLQGISSINVQLPSNLSCKGDCVVVFRTQ